MEYIFSGYMFSPSLLLFVSSFAYFFLLFLSLIFSSISQPGKNQFISKSCNLIFLNNRTPTTCAALCGIAMFLRLVSGILRGVACFKQVANQISPRDPRLVGQPEACGRRLRDDPR